MFLERRGISCLAILLAFQEGLCCMQLVIFVTGIMLILFDFAKLCSVSYVCCYCLRDNSCKIFGLLYNEKVCLLMIFF